MTADASGLTGTTPSATVALATVAGARASTSGRGGLFNAPHVDARRSAQNTADLRGKVLRIKVKAGDISTPRRTRSTAPTRCPPGTCSPGDSPDSPRGLCDGLPQPVPDDPRRERRRLRDRLLTRFAGPADRPRAAGHRSGRDRAPAGELRLAAVRDRPTCPTTSGTSTPRSPLPSVAAPATHDCEQPDPRAAEQLAVGRERRSDGRAGLEYGPPITQPRSGTPTGTTRRRRRARRASRSTGRAHRRTRWASARSCSRSCLPAASAS